MARLVLDQGSNGTRTRDNKLDSGGRTVINIPQNLSFLQGDVK